MEYVLYGEDKVKCIETSTGGHSHTPCVSSVKKHLTTLTMHTHKSFVIQYQPPSANTASLFGNINTVLNPMFLDIPNYMENKFQNLENQLLLNNQIIIYI